MQFAVAMELAAILDFGGYILPSRPKSTFMDRFVSNFLQSKFVSCTLPKYTNGYHAICGCYGNGSHIRFLRISRGTSSGCNFLLIALCCSQNMPNKHTCGMTKPIFHVQFGYFLCFSVKVVKKYTFFLLKSLQNKI